MNMNKLIKLTKILAFMLPGIFIYHVVFNLFSTIDFIAPAWLVALTAAVYTSASIHKMVYKTVTVKAKKRDRKVRVVMSQSKAKKLGLV